MKIEMNEIIILMCLIDDFFSFLVDQIRIELLATDL